MHSGWQFWIDRGGTFTDVVGRAPDGVDPHPQAAVGEPGAVPRRGDPGHPRPAGPGARATRCRTPRSRRSRWAPRSPPTRCSSARARPPCSRSPAASATRCASATRTGPTSSPATSSCRSSSTPRVIEIEERLRADGTVEQPLDRRARPRRPGARRSPPASAAVAIVLMHGYRYHAARAGGGRDRPRRSASPRSRSATEVSPLMKIVGRGDTTVVDAYLSPILRAYVDRVAAETGDVRLMFMQSQRRAGRRAPVPGQGRHPVRPGRRHRRCGQDRGRWPASSGSSASTWAAPRPTSPTMPAPSSAPSTPRSRACGCARR